MFFLVDGSLVIVHLKGMNKKDRLNRSKYGATLWDFVSLLRAKLAERDIPGLTFELNEDGCKSSRKLSLTLIFYEPTVGYHPSLLEVNLAVAHSPTGYVLKTEYQSVKPSHVVCGGRRQVNVIGSEAERVTKLVNRAVSRYEEAVRDHVKYATEAEAEAARKKQWHADFTVDGERVIPLGFAYAYRTPGEYSIDPEKSAALRCDRWRKDEVLQLAELLAKVRKAMVADGRIESKL